MLVIYNLPFVKYFVIKNNYR